MIVDNARKAAGLVDKYFADMTDAEQQELHALLELTRTECFEKSQAADNDSDFQYYEDQSTKAEELLDELEDFIWNKD